MSKMIPLRIADQAVAACEAEIQKLREEVEKLTSLNEACKRMIKRRDKWIWEHRQTNDALREAGDAMDNAISEIDPQRSERHRFMKMTDAEYLAVMKWRTAKDPNYNRA